MSSTGTCCGCFNFRQGAVLSIGIGLITGLCIVFFFSYLSFQPASITTSFFKEKILGQAAIAQFIVNVTIPLACLAALLNVSFNSGGGVKLMAFLIFLVGFCWIIYGAMFSRKLNTGYINFTPSGAMLKQYSKDTSDRKWLYGGVAVGVIGDRFAAEMLIRYLPFPLNYFYWMGMYPIVPFLIFGFVPAVCTWLAVSPLVSLSSVMDAGGDGTEYVDAKQIHWFYSLSPEERDRVREGSDLEGDSDDSDDEERALTRKKKKHHKRDGEEIEVE